MQRQTGFALSRMDRKQKALPKIIESATYEDLKIGERRTLAR
jgi:hypothetical protein